MTPSHHGGTAVRLSDPSFQAMLARAAEEGARRALNDVGLGGKDAVLTIHDMRSLLECISFVRRTAVQTAMHVITTSLVDWPTVRSRASALLFRRLPRQMVCRQRCAKQGNHCQQHGAGRRHPDVHHLSNSAFAVCPRRRSSGDHSGPISRGLLHLLADPVAVVRNTGVDAKQVGPGTFRHPEPTMPS